MSIIQKIWNYATDNLEKGKDKINQSWHIPLRLMVVKADKPNTAYLPIQIFKILMLVWQQSSKEL